MSFTTEQRKNMRKEAVMLPALGVTIWQGEIWPVGDALSPVKGTARAPHGKLAGASAELVDAGSIGGHERSGGRRAGDAVVATALLGPVGLLAGFSRRKTVAQKVTVITLADGQVITHTVSGQAIPAAVRGVARLNMMGRS